MNSCVAFGRIPYTKRKLCFAVCECRLNSKRVIHRIFSRFKAVVGKRPRIVANNSCNAFRLLSFDRKCCKQTYSRMFAGYIKMENKIRTERKQKKKQKNIVQLKTITNSIV